MFIVKPIYFKRDPEDPYRMYLIFDTENQRYERTSTGQNIMVPNYALNRNGKTVLNELKEHFLAKGIQQGGWRLTAPSFHPYESKDIYIAGAEIVAN